MRKLLGAFVLTCSVAGVFGARQAAAQQSGFAGERGDRPRWYVSPGVGLMMLDGPTDNNPVFFDCSLGYDVTDYISVEAGMMYAPLHTSAPGIKGDQSAGPTLDVLFHLLGKDGGRWDPYLTAGLAYWFGDGPLFYETYREVLVPRIGLGLAYHLSDNLSLRLEGKTGFPTQTADIDNGWITTAELGLLYRFGGGASAGDTLPPVIPEDDPYNQKLDEISKATVKHTTPVDAADWMRYEIFLNFDWDKTVIKPEYFPGLNEIARVIKKAVAANPNVTVSVEGHADRRHGSVAAYNQDLSERRAAGVKNYLLSAGVDGAKVKTIGYGFRRPKVTPDLVNGNPENRRVDVIIHGVGDAASRGRLRQED